MLSYQGSPNMQLLQKAIEELQFSVERQNMDFSLFTSIKNNLIPSLTKNSFLKYSKLMLRLYDCSTVIPTLSNEFNIKIKLFSIKMICNMVEFSYRQTHKSLDNWLLQEGVRIMILTGRLALNAGLIDEVEQYYTYCHKVLQWTENVPERLRFLHHLNNLQLLRYKVGTNQFNFKTFIMELDLVKSFQADKTEIQYISFIALQVVVKLLKLKKLPLIMLPQLKSYLPQNYMNCLQQLTHVGSGINQNNKCLSEFYHLYAQLKNNTQQQIDQQYLKQFLTIEDNLKDPRIFDAVALSQNILPLVIWFETINNKKNKNFLLKDAYNCFMYCVDSIFGIQQECQKISGMSIQWYIRLIKSISLNLINEKKDNISDIINDILKRMISVILQLIVRLTPFDILIDICQKLCLVCSKHSLHLLMKIILSIQLYVELAFAPKPREQTYEKFIKANLIDKSVQIVKILKLAYEVRKRGQNILEDEEYRLLLASKPYISILFGSQANMTMVLDLSMSEFIKIGNPLCLYFTLFDKSISLKDEKMCLAICKHLQKWLQFIDYDIKYMEGIKQLINQLFWIKNSEIFTQSQLNYLLSLLSFHLLLIEKVLKIQKVNFGILLNKYSKIIKLIDIVKDHNEIHSNEINNCMKTIIVNALQFVKEKHVESNLQRKLTEPGQLNFLQLVYENLESDPTSSEGMFLKLCIFELRCLTQTLDHFQLSRQQDQKMLRLYFQSIYIPKQAKLLILKKLLKNSLISQSPNEQQLKVTLSDFKQLLLLTTDQEQQRMYAKDIIYVFGKLGRKYLEVLTQKYQWLSQVLITEQMSS